MKVHELKTHPRPFGALMRNEKRHEVRVNDRGFELGDVLVLREYVNNFGPSPSFEYSGAVILAEVTHVTKGGEYGLPPELCVMSITIVSSHNLERHDQNL